MALLAWNKFFRIGNEIELKIIIKIKIRVKVFNTHTRLW